MTRRINIGILGCAKIAERSVIPAILQLPDLFRVSGIASRTIDRGVQFADKFRVTPVANYGALLEQENIDAVYIPLPNALHAEWIKNALVKGLHVLVEKSMASNLEEVEQLTDIAFRKNKILVENFQFRFHRQLLRIFEIIRCGELGELRCIRSSFGFPPFPDPGNIRYQKALGGGALLDAGAYPIKISQLILGSSLEVKSWRPFPMTQGKMSIYPVAVSFSKRMEHFFHKLPLDLTTTTSVALSFGEVKEGCSRTEYLRRHQTMMP